MNKIIFSFFVILIGCSGGQPPLTPLGEKLGDNRGNFEFKRRFEENKYLENYDLIEFNDSTHLANVEDLESVLRDKGIVYQLEEDISFSLPLTSTKNYADEYPVVIDSLLFLNFQKDVLTIVVRNNSFEKAPASFLRINFSEMTFDDLRIEGDFLEFWWMPLGDELLFKFLTTIEDPNVNYNYYQIIKCSAKRNIVESFFIDPNAKEYR